MNDITEQPLSENQAVIRTNMRNAVKRVRALRAEADKIVENLKSALKDEKNQSACGETLKAFRDAVDKL